LIATGANDTPQPKQNLPAKFFFRKKKLQQLESYGFFRKENTSSFEKKHCINRSLTVAQTKICLYIASQKNVAVYVSITLDIILTDFCSFKPIFNRFYRFNGE